MRPRATVSASRQRAQKTAQRRATSSGQRVAIGRQRARGDAGGGDSLVLGSQQTTIVSDYIAIAEGATVERPRLSNGGRNVDRPSSSNAGCTFKRGVVLWTGNASRCRQNATNLYPLRLAAAAEEAATTSECVSACLCVRALHLVGASSAAARHWY